MAGILDSDVCQTCGEEYWYSYKGFEYSKVSMCECDRYVRNVEEFLKQKGMLEEFERFHEERERED